MPESRPLTAVSLFAGVGGCCRGVSAAGFDVRVAVESDPAACQTLAANASGNLIFASDIRYFMGQHADVHRRRYCLGDVDLVVGGPPCQGHSAAGQRDARDPRNGLWRQFARVVGELRPKAIMLENVPGLLQTDQGRLTAEILATFRSAGYCNAYIHRLDAVDFGIPQTRKRIFILATRDDVPLSAPLAALFRDGLRRAHRPRVSVTEAIGDLPGEAWDSGHEPMQYPQPAMSGYAREMRRGVQMLTHHHTKAICADRRRAIIAALAQGEDGSSLPPELFSGSRGTKWRRLHPHRPSPTILSNASRDLSSWIHPVHPRFLTVREAARLQGFPDLFQFPCSESAALRQIGNAVPPALAQAVARVLAQALRAGEGPPLKRGRPPIGERAQTGAERRRTWRNRNKIGTLELPADVLLLIRQKAEAVGLTMAAVVEAAIKTGC
jgi:DNA (cytosine-5)-methyltransferase 1